MRHGRAPVTAASGSKRPELSVVMPVYNEELAVGPVVRSWAAELDRLKIEYELRVYDDGSRDGTHAVLRRLALDLPRVVVSSHANMGHGPTISKGYRESAGDWIFQVDSDDEMTPDAFAGLWAARGDYDLLLGCRKDRQSRASRRIISAGSRAIVAILFGRGLWDVNTPYRLIRRSALHSLLPRIPADTFAPNVILAGLAARDGLRTFQTWVPHQVRRVGTGSIVGWGQWKTALRCAAETASVALKARGTPARGVPLEHGAD